MISCESKGKPNMAPHAQSGVSMYSCGEKRRCHIVTGKEKQPATKMQPPTATVLWHP
ncbi:MAG: hypothetical protein M1167_07880 [Chloroflexi bacterium]|nr:hypothetical protein [Chloroflexota bacterium]